MDVGVFPFILCISKFTSYIFSSTITLANKGKKLYIRNYSQPRKKIEKKTNAK
jgi:hypothetical protein